MPGSKTSAIDTAPLPKVSRVSIQAAAAPIHFIDYLFNKTESHGLTGYGHRI